LKIDFFVEGHPIPPNRHSWVRPTTDDSWIDPIHVWKAQSETHLIT